MLYEEDQIDDKLRRYRANWLRKLQSLIEKEITAAECDRAVKFLSSITQDLDYPEITGWVLVDSPKALVRMTGHPDPPSSLFFFGLDAVDKIPQGFFVCQENGKEPSSAFHDSAFLAMHFSGAYVCNETFTLYLARRPVELRTLDGKLHDVDGPAVVYADGSCESWLFGERISKMNYNWWDEPIPRPPRE